MATLNAFDLSVLQAGLTCQEKHPERRVSALHIAKQLKLNVRKPTQVNDSLYHHLEPAGWVEGVWEGKNKRWIFKKQNPAVASGKSSRKQKSLVHSRMDSSLSVSSRSQKQGSRVMHEPAHSPTPPSPVVHYWTRNSVLSASAPAWTPPVMGSSSFSSSSSSSSSSSPSSQEHKQDEEEEEDEEEQEQGWHHVPNQKEEKKNPSRSCDAQVSQEIRRSVRGPPRSFQQKKKKQDSESEWVLAIEVEGLSHLLAKIDVHLFLPQSQDRLDAKGLSFQVFAGPLYNGLGVKPKTQFQLMRRMEPCVENHVWMTMLLWVHTQMVEADLQGRTLHVGLVSGAACWPIFAEKTSRDSKHHIRVIKTMDEFVQWFESG